MQSFQRQYEFFEHTFYDELIGMDVQKKSVAIDNKFKILPEITFVSLDSSAAFRVRIDDIVTHVDGNELVHYDTLTILLARSRPVTLR